MKAPYLVPFTLTAQAAPSSLAPATPAAAAAPAAAPPSPTINPAVEQAMQHNTELLPMMAALGLSVDDVRKHGPRGVVVQNGLQQLIDETDARSA